MLIGVHYPFRTADLDPHQRHSFQFALRFHGRTPPVVMGQPAAAIAFDSAQTPSGDLVLFSGHILNRSALRRTLGGGLTSDAALYACGYARWHDDVDLRVIGQYSVIIIHGQEPTVRLAASPITCTPLHYCHDGTQFLAASRAQALFDSTRVERILDEQKVADSLFLNYQDPARGWFLNVVRLGAGQRAIASPDGVRTEQYYRFEDLPDVRLRSDADYVEAANALFRQGTAEMIDGFAKPAILLSGGYDSQAVAACVMELRPDKKVQSFTGVPEKGWDGIVSKGHFGDERPYVEALAQRYPQLEPHWIDAAGRSMDYFQREMFAFALQSPRNNMNLHWIHDAYRAARAEACDVVLTGAMGNISFSYTGIHALSGWLARGNIAALTKELLSAGSVASIPRRFFRQAVLPLLPPRWLNGLVSLRRGTADDVFASWCPMNRSYAVEMGVVRRAEALRFDPHFRPPAHSRAFRSRLMQFFAGEWSDTCLSLDAIHGTATRDPTSYRPLVEFCSGLPDDQYLRAGKRRWLAKRMLQDKLPPIVLQETRTGMQAADWHLRLSRQRESLTEELTWLKEDPAMARRLDLDGMLNALKNFPSETPRDPQIADRLMLATTRGISVARFIRFLEGRNN